MSKLQTIYARFLDYTGLEIVISYFKKRFTSIETRYNELEEYVKTLSELVDSLQRCHESDFSNDFNFSGDAVTQNIKEQFSDDYNVDFKTVSTYKSSIIGYKEGFNDDYNADFKSKS